MQKWLKDIHLPVTKTAGAVKGVFQFQAPTRVFLGGSAPLNMCVRPDKAADLIMEMPKVRYLLFLMYDICLIRTRVCLKISQDVFIYLELFVLRQNSDK